MIEDSAKKSLLEKLSSVRSRIDAAAKRVERTPEEITLVAVTKKVDVEDIFVAMEGGQLIFGENYVQEAQRKITALNEELSKRASPMPVPRFHLIGSLQRNKVKHAVGLFDVIETVDRLELAQAVSARAEQMGLKQSVLIQVNVSGEATKSGVVLEEVKELTRDMMPLAGVELQGLMSIGHFYPEDVADELRRSEFVTMRSLKEAAEQELGVPLAHLSMGMSHDFELAIEEGATMVRVGSAIFGERE